MDNRFTPAGAPAGGPAELAALRDLLAVIADPAAARARLDQIETSGAEIERAQDRLAADRAAFAAEQAEAKRELVDQAKRIEARKIELRDLERVRAEQEQRIAAYAERVGYRERPSVIEGSRRDRPRHGELAGRRAVRRGSAFSCRRTV